MNKIFISCKESRIDNHRTFYGCFELSAFCLNDSLTVANALRRTLLSDCTGVAVVSVLIENVHHEYSTLPGVRESVLDILLNFKELVFKKRPRLTRNSNPITTHNINSKNNFTFNTPTSFMKPVIGYLKVKGPGVIRAKHLRLPPILQCVDPEQYIATLGDDAYINMQFVIQSGTDYVLADKQREYDSLTNPIHDTLSTHDVVNSKLMSPNKTRRLYLDAVFNPITKVNYIINDIYPTDPYKNPLTINRKVSEQKYQNILLEIWTNGSVHPREALSNSLFHLSHEFLLLQQVLK